MPRPPSAPPLIPSSLLSNEVSYRSLGSDRGLVVGCGFMRKPGIIEDFVDRQPNEYSAVLVLRGRGTYRDPLGRSWPLRPGSLLQRFTIQRHTHLIEPGCDWAEGFIVLGQPIERLLLDTGTIDPARPVLEPGLDLDLIRSLARRCDQLRQASIDSLPSHLWALLGLLQTLLDRGRSEETEPPHRQAILQAMQRLARTPGLPLAQLARSAGLSSERYRKVFQLHAGATLASFRTRCRLDLARERFLDPTASLSDIAADLGYANASAFTVAFKRETGLAPSAYRRMSAPRDAEKG